MGLLILLINQINAMFTRSYVMFYFLVPVVFDALTVGLEARGFKKFC